MPEKTGSTWEQREYNNDLAQIHASGGNGSVPGATVPLTAAGDERGERGAKIVEGVRHAVDRATG